MKFTVQEHRLTKRLSQRARECFPCPTPYHDITKGLFTAFPFISTSGETEQASELESDMSQTLELSEQTFFKTMINMLKGFTAEVDNIQEQMDNIRTEPERL